MTWFHLILAIYIILTVGPLITTLCIDTPAITTESKPSESPAPSQLPTQQINEA